MSLRTENLTVTRGYRALFSDLNFSLADGQCLLVEGENGSGKTSLLKTLVGFRRPDSGLVYWSGKPVPEKDTDFLSQSLWLGHHNPLKEHLTAEENLLQLLSLKNRNETSLTEALQQTGLLAYRNQLVKTFSAGMKRRLSLTLLLLVEAKLWVLDEPQAALDRQGIVMFEKMALSFLETGGSIVMTSHHEVELSEHRLKRLNLSER